MKGVPDDYPARIKQLRARLGLTQVRFAALLCVSHTTVNRWENAKSRPNRLSWGKILRVEREGLNGFDKPPVTYGKAASRVGGNAAELREEYKAFVENPAPVDFAGHPEKVRVVIEAERLAYGHLFNPAFATEISIIDPLPHQRIAVYEYMLPQPRLRFLLADDAGAGKTIMAGLYIREMLTRRLIRRVLIVPPAGLVGNWEREMRTLFSLPFRIISGADSRTDNPFTGSHGDLLIVSMDTLGAPRTFGRLRAGAVEPYDLIIFDEAHKLAADRNPDLTVRKTDRYRLAEALTGATQDPAWQLPWHGHHVLLLTATPHMGKGYPYYCLWRLLEPELLSTVEAFHAYPTDARRRHYIRRTKEEMVRFDGTPIYPTRTSDTLSYELGTNEQLLYDRTTDYIKTYYNRARILNRTAARLAMSVFQRRLASSTYALKRSLERRLTKLSGLIEDIKGGRFSTAQLGSLQRKIDAVPDIFEQMTGDEEEARDGREQNETTEDRLLGGVVAVSLAELETERLQVAELIRLAEQVMDAGEESKFNRLCELLTDNQFKDEKILIFTEHRDTLDYLIRRLEGLGYAGKTACIHGGMPYGERERQMECFRRSADQGGATVMVATDAAGEGINLQFCWLMVNYDIPWNPARIEQRLGRIHRYKQMHDPVLLFNLVAGKTREGRVLRTLLTKLERIRRELDSDKVFDVIGRLFEDVSLKDLILQAVVDDQSAQAVEKIEGLLTPAQTRARKAQMDSILESGGDVVRQLPDQQAKREREELRRLVPGYVRHFITKSAPLLGIGVEGDLETGFAFKPLRTGALDPLWSVLESYAPEQRRRLTVYRPQENEPAIYLHPGEPVFERYRMLVRDRLAAEARRGGVFFDPYAEHPYFFHLFLGQVVRGADAEMPGALAREERLDVRLIGLRQDTTGAISECPVEHLMILRGGKGIPLEHLSFAGTVTAAVARAEKYAVERVITPLVEARRQTLLDSLPARQEFLSRGYAYRDAELARVRAELTQRVRRGDRRRKGELRKVKQRQQDLNEQRSRAQRVLAREPQLIRPGGLCSLAHALIIPTADPRDRMRHDREVERVAMRVARAYEEGQGYTVADVSTPEAAVRAGLEAHPGFDLLSRRTGTEERAIEVKGRAGVGDVFLSANEWARACNLRARYRLYVVFDCAGAHPRLLRIRDPFGALLVRDRGGVVIGEDEIFKAAEAGVPDT